MTAEQLMAELAADRGHVERQDRQDQELRSEEARLARAETPLLKDLQVAGADLTTVWDLVNTRRKYPKLVPVLLAHLDRDYPDKVREGIARALAVPGARVGWKQLLRGFSREPASDARGDLNQIKWALHLAIALAADASVLDDLISLAADRRHGEHRSFFVDALSRIDDPRSRAALEELRPDRDLAEGFRRISGKRRSRRG